MHVAWTLHVATTWKDVVRTRRKRPKKPLGLVRPGLPTVGAATLLHKRFAQARLLLGTHLRAPRLNGVGSTVGRNRYILGRRSNMNGDRSCIPALRACRLKGVPHAEYAHIGERRNTGAFEERELALSDDDGTENLVPQHHHDQGI